MPKRTKEQLTTEIKKLAEHIEACVALAFERDALAFERDLDLQWIGMAKRRAQELAVECQRLEDLMDDGIEEAVQHLRKGLDDE
jgi:hypothetical protein